MRTVGPCGGTAAGGTEVFPPDHESASSAQPAAVTGVRVAASYHRAGRKTAVPRSAISRRTALAAGAGAVAAALAGCTTSNGSPGRASSPAFPTPSPGDTAARPTPTGPPDPRDVVERATVPVLCWHQLRDWEQGDSEYSRNILICPPENFRDQLDAIADDGWTPIDTDRYLEHLTTGRDLPAKSVLLTFDDGTDSQLSEGLVQLSARRMTATFFPMTVVLGNEGWMSPEDLKRLTDAGMVVGAHTWDHHRVDLYQGEDWHVQLDRPREALEQIIGAPVKHMAYPHGAWNAAALPHVVSAGYESAYQLSDRPMDPQLPLQTLRRTMVPSTWRKPEMLDFLSEYADGKTRF